MSLLSEKKGLSTIVATLLIILLTLVAVGIIWIVVKGVLQGGAEQVSLGKFTLDLEIENVAIDPANSSNVIVNIKRNAGEGEISGLKFIVDDGDNTEVVTLNNFSLGQLDERTINLSLTSTINTSNIQKVSVAPIFKLESGKVITGDVKSEYTVSSSSLSSKKGCTSSSQCNDGNACTIDTCSARKCLYTPISNCCTSASQCNDSNVCTSDTCVNNACTHSPIANCCTSSSQCNDNNACTTDICSTNSCSNIPATNCCTSSSQCNDNNACTVDSCAANSTCMYASITTCSLTNNDGCCPSGICNYLTDMNCVQCTVANQATTCNDNHSCTTDICSSGMCAHSAISNCCETNPECVDGNSCTTDICSNNVCSHIPATPCCGNSIIEGTEQCDGSALGGATCASVMGTGYNGTLSCNSSCRFVTSSCVAPCVPNCAGRVCGSDPVCGQSCGTCSVGTCNATGQCVVTSQTNYTELSASYFGFDINSPNNFNAFRTLENYVNGNKNILVSFSPGTYNLTFPSSGQSGYRGLQQAACWFNNSANIIINASKAEFFVLNSANTEEMVVFSFSNSRNISLNAKFRGVHTGSNSNGAKGVQLWSNNSNFNLNINSTQMFDGVRIGNYEDPASLSTPVYFNNSNLIINITGKDNYYTAVTYLANNVTINSNSIGTAQNNFGAQRAVYVTGSKDVWISSQFKDMSVADGVNIIGSAPSASSPYHIGCSNIILYATDLGTTHYVEYQSAAKIHTVSSSVINTSMTHKNITIYLNVNSIGNEVWRNNVGVAMGAYSEGASHRYEDIKISGIFNRSNSSNTLLSAIYLESGGSMGMGLSYLNLTLINFQDLFNRSLPTPTSIYIASAKPVVEINAYNSSLGKVILGNSSIQTFTNHS